MKAIRVLSLVLAAVRIAHDSHAEAGAEHFSVTPANRVVLRVLCTLLLFLGMTQVSAQTPGTLVSWGDQVIPYVLQGTRYRAIAAGWSHSLALKSDGTVVAWGQDNNGQSKVPANLSGVTAIAAGESHSLALKLDGSVVAWGYNGSGLSTVPANLSGVTAIAAGKHHNLALKSDGTIVTWGYNDYGQSTVPANLSGVTAIAAGALHSLALKTDGTVVAWGYDGTGQSTVPANLSGVIAIAAGAFHSLALKSDGTIIVWGDNGVGLSGVTALAGGIGNSLALKSDGTVVAWGDNSYGQSSVPANLSGVTAIAAGGYHNLALKSDGTVVAWGDNSYGQSIVPASLNGVAVISAGRSHCLALNPNGTVVAWGDNSYGQSSVPANLSGVIAIAGGERHSLALKSDGTVAAWGYNAYGESTVPGILSGVTAIAAGGNHSLALNPNGTVVAWGDNSYGQSSVPANLSGVTAIAAGFYHSLALRSDGKVVAWGYNGYGESTVPANLSGVTAIAAGFYHSLALRSDGKVVAWGAGEPGQTGAQKSYDQSTVPGNLSGVTAIAAGGYHSLALRLDATVVAWGAGAPGQTRSQDFGQSTVPANLLGVVAIASGGNRNLAVVAAQNKSPVILVQPSNRAAQAGATVSFSVGADGKQPLDYQWRRNGVNISGAITPTLTLNSVTAMDSDGYSVLVWNAYGSVVSDTAYLVVLADGANEYKLGRMPAEPITSSPSSGPKNLILVTHGWQPRIFYPSGPPSQDWMVEMTNVIAQQLIAQGKASEWKLEAYYWLSDAWMFDSNIALRNAERKGALVGKQLADQGWEKVHLIAHSAGAQLIQAITDQLVLAPTRPVIHETFLDPFTGRFRDGRDTYGRYADWADNYFVYNSGTDLGGILELNSPNSTAGPLDNAYNVDVGGTLQAAFSAAYVAEANTSTTLVSLAPSHDTPVDFYTSTIKGLAPSCAVGFGFPFSMEAGGSSSWLTHQTDNSPHVLCGSASFVQKQPPTSLNSALDFSVLPSANSTTGVIFLGTRGAKLTTTLSAPRENVPGEVRVQGGETTTNSPSWLALGVTVTNMVNFVQFDASFSNTNMSAGLLSVFWNTNNLGDVDERTADLGLRTYRFPLPGTITNGSYSLSFRVDGFTNMVSSVLITNVATGFVGLPEPITLGVMFTNGSPLLILKATSNFTYVVQSSTNLLNWRPLAVVLQTNSTTRLPDMSFTNSAATFYRAFLP